MIVVSKFFRFWRLSRKRFSINATTHTFLERSRKDLSGNIWVVALIVYRFRDKRQKHQHRRLNLEFLFSFYRLSRKRLTINATTYKFPERSFRDLSKDVWVVTLIVYRFRNKRQKHQYRRLNL